MPNREPKVRVAAKSLTKKNQAEQILIIITNKQKI